MQSQHVDAQTEEIIHSRLGDSAGPAIEHKVEAVIGNLESCGAGVGKLAAVVSEFDLFKGNLE